MQRMTPRPSCHPRCEKCCGCTMRDQHGSRPADARLPSALRGRLGRGRSLWDTWSDMPGRAALVVVGLVLGCSHSRPARNLDLDQIRVLDGARLRTDTVGDGKFAITASFVLVDAENAAAEGAHVTLGGELTDATGATVGELKAQSLWIPPHQARTFALVDRQRATRPTAAAARIKVYGAVIPDEPPRAQITELHSFDDRGKIVVQAYL